MIAQTIQLALAPVFLVVAVGNFLNILTTRLGRIVDRSRRLQDLHVTTKGKDHDAVVAEIRVIDERIRLIGRAIRLLVLAGLTVGVTVALLFVEGLGKIDLQFAIACTFMLAITFMMSALVLFLRETRLASDSLRIHNDYLEY